MAFIVFCLGKMVPTLQPYSAYCSQLSCLEELQCSDLIIVTIGDYKPSTFSMFILNVGLGVVKCYGT